MEQLLLNYTQQTQALVIVYLINGIGLKGYVQAADTEVIWLKFNGHSHLIQKTMIATILFQ